VAVIQTPDSSVLIPALQVGHPSHAEARKVLSRRNIKIIGHVALETFATMTSATYKPRTAPSASAAAIAQLDSSPLTLSVKGYADLIERAGASGIMGGAIYDALIAITATEHNARLISRDVRAAATYRALGVDFEMLTV
jgi:predicted nucleic acid-binding protein